MCLACNVVIVKAIVIVINTFSTYIFKNNAPATTWNQIFILDIKF